ncbi:uncharacterized protein [Watersipora subatra]|uniref:uncharacterized protein isoform X2 n=1 Tax=Watersipora subatra TaxID=2589382 RepID=UPI00355B9B24
MRALVNYNITAITCKNAYDKTPFQVALMGKQKATAGFLLGKQWSRIQYGPVANGISLPLNIYSKMKNWCERAKDRNYHNNGPSRSTLKRRPYITMGGTLVGIGVLVDGYSSSLMNGRSTPTQEKKIDRSFLILPSDKEKPPPKQYFKAVTNATKGGKQSRTKISNLAQRGGRQASRSDGIVEEDIQTVRLVNQDTALSKLEEAVVEDMDMEERMHSLRSTNSRAGKKRAKGPSTAATTVDSSKLPQLPDRKTSKTLGNKENEGHYIETGKEDRSKGKGKSKTEEKKERMVISAMKKAKVKTVEYSIPLPLINTENNVRPYLQHCKSKETDPALTTLALYERYRGLKSRDYAIKCLSIASNFKDKPWLQQVRLAMDLTSQDVKKRVSSENLNLSKRSQSSF